MKLKKYIYGKIKENRNMLAIYTILSRIKNQDKEMIDLVLTIEDRADYIKIEKHGEGNPGRIIYVIHEMGRGYGFFAELKITLLGLYYAERMGFIPYVEWGKDFAYYEPIIALESFKEAFGEKVKYCRDVYRSDGNQNIVFSKLEWEQHHYRLGLEVLRDAYILSRCEYLIAGLSQVSFSSRLLKASRNESYCEMVIINNGINVGTENFKYD